MKELALNILDIAKNSVKANATLIEILIIEKANLLILHINDNGCGMKAAFLSEVTNPFKTTRTTRKVGLGLPMLKMAAEQTGGCLKISSVSIEENSKNHGTKVTAEFYTDHIDFYPIGDVVSTLTTLIHGSPNVDFYFKHSFKNHEVTLDTRELRSVLEDVPLDSYEVINWISEYLREQYSNP